MSDSKKPAVTLNFLNPGLCQTAIVNGASLMFFLLLRLVGRTSEVGGRTLVAAASAGPETHGQYMNDGVIAK